MHTPAVETGSVHPEDACTGSKRLKITMAWAKYNTLDRYNRQPCTHLLEPRLTTSYSIDSVSLQKCVCWSGRPASVLLDISDPWMYEYTSEYFNNVMRRKLRFWTLLANIT